MSHKNSIVKANYIIDITSAVQDEYSYPDWSNLSYQSDFNADADNMLPVGWSSNESNEDPLMGPRIQPNNAQNNKVLALIDRLDIEADVTDPPVVNIEEDGSGEASYFRWVELSNTFNKPVRVNFKVYEGRDTVGEYSCDENPNSDNSEFLWLQYKIGANGNWTTSGEPIRPVEKNEVPNAGIWNLEHTVVREIGDLGQNAGNPLHLRWIVHARTIDNTSNYDTWAIDEIIPLAAIKTSNSAIDFLY